MLDLLSTGVLDGLPFEGRLKIREFALENAGLVAVGRVSGKAGFRDGSYLQVEQQFSIGCSLESSGDGSDRLRLSPKPVYVASTNGPLAVDPLELGDSEVEGHRCLVARLRELAERLDDSARGGGRLTELPELLAAANDELCPDRKKILTPKSSTFFATARVDEAPRYRSISDGDLWPSAWSDDDWLYCANGDGKGFDLEAPWADIVMNRVAGHPGLGGLRGERLSSGDTIGSIWGDPRRFNRKPTGMLSAGGVLYLAVQDLSHGARGAFDQAPSATILRSDDKGLSWNWDRSAPMFSDGKFTTIMFLDFGRDGANDLSEDYFYAYGLDHNWRDSFSDLVPDPTELFLARLPREGVQNVALWEFYRGNLKGVPSWSEAGDIDARRPVLVDQRRLYARKTTPEGPANLSVLSQGGVVYNRPLNRYIYTSWTEYTFEFYEAPAPWGQWRHFLSKDFGAYPWSERSHGGYATVIPSKYISDDGREMWVSSSSFMGGVKDYHLSLRKLQVAPYEQAAADNGPGEANLALPANCPDVVPVSAGSLRSGNIEVINDGSKAGSEDSWSGEQREEDWWGYTWSRPYNLNTVRFTSGKMYPDGGWFEDIRVQIRRDFVWRDVEDLNSDRAYPGTGEAGSNLTYTFTFKSVQSDGVRIAGAPGGSGTFTSVAELEVYYSSGVPDRPTSRDNLPGPTTS